MAVKFYAPIPFDELSDFMGEPVEKLMERPYRELTELVSSMRKEKAAAEKKQNAEDQEYARIAKKYFTPWSYLSQFWAEDDILYAVSQNATLRDLVEEKAVRKGQKCLYPNAEYIRTSYEYLPRFTKSGEELMERERALCDVYRVVNKHQSLVHGKVILALLYQTYPELKKFEFKAYGMDSGEYEIYPKNNIYTPFSALMRKDVETIKKRNIDYCNSYHWGEFTQEKCRERLEGEDGQHYFDVIHSLKLQTNDHRVF